MAHKLRQAVSAPELRQPLTAGVLGKEETWPLHVSQDVSNSIDLIGNYAFDGLPACCIGCATQRRCWGGLHHMAFISIIVAVIIVLFPHMLPKCVRTARGSPPAPSSHSSRLRIPQCIADPLCNSRPRTGSRRTIAQCLFCMA